jgi:hypothetical protein
VGRGGTEGLGSSKEPLFIIIVRSCAPLPPGIVALTCTIGGANRFKPLLLPLDGQVPLQQGLHKFPISVL